MFGATFVFPLIMGLNPQLAVMMSGIATICFLLIVQGKVPSYLGTSASFVGGVAAIRAQGGDSSDVTGAILIAGFVLLLIGILIHFAGSHLLQLVLPPVVTGAVVMLIGFNLAPVVADTYWPQDQWVAFLTMTFVVLVAVGVRGFFGRIAIFLGLIFGYVLSWLADSIFGQITSFDAGAGKVTTHDRVSWTALKAADWIGFPPHTDNAKGIVGWHWPSFSITFTLLVLPGRDRPDRREHRARQGRRGDDAPRPQPRHGPRHRRRRLRDDAGQHVRWLARPRRTRRTSG